MPENFGYIDKIHNNYEPKMHKSFKFMTPAEASALALTSIFDNGPTGKEGQDGMISKDEVARVSKEEYAKYVDQMKAELSKEKGKEAIKDMILPSYDEFLTFVKDKPVGCNFVLNFLREKNPQINEEPFNEKVFAGKMIAGIFAPDSQKESQKVLNYVLSGKDEDFNKSCDEADEVFDKYDIDKNGILSTEEQDNYLKAQKDDQKESKKAEVERSDLILQFYFNKKEKDLPQKDDNKPLNKGKTSS